MDLLTITLAVPVPRSDIDRLSQESHDDIITIIDKYFRDKGVERYQVAEVQAVFDADLEEPRTRHLARNFIVRPLRDIPMVTDEVPPAVATRRRYVYANSWEHLDEHETPYMLRWVYDRITNDVTDTSTLGGKTIPHGSPWWNDLFTHLTDANAQVLNGTGDLSADWGVHEAHVEELPEWAVEARKAYYAPPAAT